MGMKPRKKPAPVKKASIEITDAPTQRLLAFMNQISEDPGDQAEVLAWGLGLILATFVPSGSRDVAADDLRNEILIKACLLEVNEEQRKEAINTVVLGE